ncbi:hypothetical protein HDU67_008877, partial [Dinochytrium kinnereticum]
MDVAKKLSMSLDDIAKVTGGGSGYKKNVKRYVEPDESSQGFRPKQKIKPIVWDEPDGGSPPTHRLPPPPHQNRGSGGPYSHKGIQSRLGGYVNRDREDRVGGGFDRGGFYNHRPNYHSALHEVDRDGSRPYSKPFYGYNTKPVREDENISVTISNTSRRNLPANDSEDLSHFLTSRQQNRPAPYTLPSHGGGARGRGGGGAGRGTSSTGRGASAAAGKRQGTFSVQFGAMKDEESVLDDEMDLGGEEYEIQGGAGDAVDSYQDVDEADPPLTITIRNNKYQVPPPPPAPTPPPPKNPASAPVAANPQQSQHAQQHRYQNHQQQQYQQQQQQQQQSNPTEPQPPASRNTYGTRPPAPSSSQSPVYYPQPTSLPAQTPPQPPQPQSKMATSGIFQSHRILVPDDAPYSLLGLPPPAPPPVPKSQPGLMLSVADGGRTASTVLAGGVMQREDGRVRKVYALPPNAPYPGLAAGGGLLGGSGGVEVKPQTLNERFSLVCTRQPFVPYYQMNLENFGDEVVGQGADASGDGGVAAYYGGQGGYSGM